MLKQLSSLTPSQIKNAQKGAIIFAIVISLIKLHSYFTSRIETYFKFNNGNPYPLKKMNAFVLIGFQTALYTTLVMFLAFLFFAFIGLMVKSKACVDNLDASGHEDLGTLAQVFSVLYDKSYLLWLVVAVITGVIFYVIFYMFMHFSKLKLNLDKLEVVKTIVNYYIIVFGITAIALLAFL
jgi:magnesium-transporting ATPase (P-type)